MLDDFISVLCINVVFDDLYARPIEVFWMYLHKVGYGSLTCMLELIVLYKLVYANQGEHFGCTGFTSE